MINSPDGLDGTPVSISSDRIVQSADDARRAMVDLPWVSHSSVSDRSRDKFGEIPTLDHRTSGIDISSAAE